MSVLTMGISRPDLRSRFLNRILSIDTCSVRERAVSFDTFEMQTSRRGAIPDYIAESSGEVSLRETRAKERGEFVIQRNRKVLRWYHDVLLCNVLRYDARCSASYTLRI